jgi:hypothetical protein
MLVLIFTYLQLVEKVTGKVVGSIVKSDSDVTLVHTIIDTNSAVRDASNLCPVQSRGDINPGGLLVPITTGTVAD